MLEVRTPTEDEREQIGSVMSISLNFGQAWAERRAPSFRLEQFLVAVDEGRVVATSAARPFLQWFGGRSLPMTGIYAVATLPEHRGGGLASRLVTDLLRRGREEGAVISALYPAAVRPYRSIGYELAGTYTDHRISISDLPSGSAPLRVEEYRAEDLDGVKALFRDVLSTQNGPIYSELDDWWDMRIVGTREPDVLFLVVCFNDLPTKPEGRPKPSPEFPRRSPLVPRAWAIHGSTCSSRWLIQHGIGPR